MALIDDVKVNLRISTTAFDDAEIQPLIDACKIDLKNSGVHGSRIDDADPLIKRAVTLYCKANFGSNPNAEKLNNSYELLKISLALAGDYNTEADDG